LKALPAVAISDLPAQVYLIKRELKDSVEAGYRFPLASSVSN